MKLPLNMRIDKALKRELEEEARRDGRTLSNYVVQVLKKREKVVSHEKTNRK